MSFILVSFFYIY